MSRYDRNILEAIEAFALGVPAIGSRIGGIPELIKDGETGLLFEAGDAIDLNNKIRWVLDNPDAISKMGHNARTLAEKQYSPGLHYERLMKIYEKALRPEERIKNAA